MGELGKFLLIIGIVLVILGVIFSLGSRIPWLGHLPGDFTLRRGSLTVYFPLTTCLLISVILSLVLYFFKR